MLTRLLLDPRDGRPRHPVFWLVAAAIASAQLLVFYGLCNRQVRTAEAQRDLVVLVRQATTARCDDPTSADCAVFHGPGPAVAQYAVR